MLVSAELLDYDISRRVEESLEKHSHAVPGQITLLSLVVFESALICGNFVMEIFGLWWDAVNITGTSSAWAWKKPCCPYGTSCEANPCRAGPQCCMPCPKWARLNMTDIGTESTYYDTDYIVWFIRCMAHLMLFSVLSPILYTYWVARAGFVYTTTVYATFYHLLSWNGFHAFPTSTTSPVSDMVAQWLGRLTCDQLVVGLTPSQALLCNNLRQVVYTGVSLSPSSIIW